MNTERTGRVEQNTGTIKRACDHLYGGIHMTWIKVILFAVGTAVLTFLFLVLPVFRNTSFERMGVYLEAWIFFAVIIMSNCKSPLDSALKTFVFFLVSQPLIYLLQVPFNQMGWGIFRFYRNWFIWTLLTFPMAFVGWYIRKKNWLSLLILSPVLVFLTSVYISSFRSAFGHFPHLLVTAVFCLAQVFLYLYVFTSNIWQKFAGFLLPLAAMLILVMFRPQVEINANNFLPDDPILTDAATVVMENESAPIQIAIERTGKDSMIRIQATEFGKADFSIVDGDQEYMYTANVYEDDGGHTQIEITSR